MVDEIETLTDDEMKEIAQEYVSGNYGGSLHLSEVGDHVSLKLDNTEVYVSKTEEGYLFQQAKDRSQAADYRETDGGFT